MFPFSLKVIIQRMEAKKVKRILSIIFAAQFTTLIVVFPSCSVIILSQCKFITYTNIYHDVLMQNLSDTFNVSDTFV